MKITLKALLSHIIYIFVLLGAYFLIKETPTFNTPVILLLNYSSYIIFILGLILCIRFNQGRVFLIILLLALLELILNCSQELSKYIELYSEILYPTMCILIPLNLITFSQLKEKGIFSLWGKMRILFILVELVIIYYFSSCNDLKIENLLNYNFINLPFQEIAMPQIGLILFTLTLIFFIIKIFLKDNVLETRLIGVTISLFLALILINDSLSFSIYLSAAGLLLVIGIIEDSYSMAYLDELTGIPSRRALREDLMKLGSKYTIAMTDIDFFKKFNDKYGHDVGDDVLKLVASNLTQVTGGGKAFRYGGEEFTIVFPGKSIEDVMPHLESIREQISKCGYTRKPSTTKTSKSKRGNSSQLFVTISIGVCEKSNKFKNPNEVMKGADKALYKAKKKGRNCVSK
ncbi:GGDEF domain-containing protein [Clostridium saccharoperbutylacetonicum]